MADRYRDEQEMADRRVGRLCAVIAEPNRNRDKKKQPFTELDFMPGPVERKEQSVEEQKAILSGIGVR